MKGKERENPNGCACVRAYIPVVFPCFPFFFHFPWHLSASDSQDDEKCQQVAVQHSTRSIASGQSVAVKERGFGFENAEYFGKRLSSIGKIIFVFIGRF